MVKMYDNNNIKGKREEMELYHCGSLYCMPVSIIFKVRPK